jgi:hypothetical protein
MTLETILGDIIASLRQGRFPNEQAISRGIVLRVPQELNWDIYDTTLVWPEFQTGEDRTNFAPCLPPNAPRLSSQSPAADTRRLKALSPTTHI